MDQQKKQIVIAAGLAIILIGVVFYQLVIAGGDKGTPQKSKKSTATPTAIAQAQSAQASPTKIKAVDVDIDALLREIEVVTFNYENERIDRNPMTPLIGQINTGDQLTELPLAQASPMQIMQKQVTGIVYDEYNPVAVIDDEVVGLGHVYPDGTKVYAIERDRVVFMIGTAKIPVELKEL